MTPVRAQRRPHQTTPWQGQVGARGNRLSADHRLGALTKNHLVVRQAGSCQAGRQACRQAGTPKGDGSPIVRYDLLGICLLHAIQQPVGQHHSALQLRRQHQPCSMVAGAEVGAGNEPQAASGGARNLLPGSRTGGRGGWRGVLGCRHGQQMAERLGWAGWVAHLRAGRCAGW